MFDKQSNWYALYLRSRYEKRTDAELQRKGIESFLPLIETTHIWSDRKKKIEEPLFRSYLFVKSDLGNKVDILQTDGVVKFIGIGGKPSSIPEEQISWIRLLVNHPLTLRREKFMAVGQKARVIAGAFIGMEGFILKVKNKTRMIVSLDSAMLSVSVEIPSEMLQWVE